MKIIRSYDFESHKDMYIEGVVAFEQNGLYKCVVINRVVRGESVPVEAGETFFTPVEGNPGMILDWDGRIEVILELDEDSNF